MAEEVKKTSEPKVVSAKKTVTMEDVKFNEANKTKAILACFGFVGLIMLLIEKDDQFVRYMGAQFAILGAVVLGLSLLSMFVIIIPIFNIFIGALVGVSSIAMWVIIVIGAIKSYQGNRFDIPVIKDWAIKLMNSI